VANTERLLPRHPLRPHHAHHDRPAAAGRARATSPTDCSRLRWTRSAEL